MNTFTGTFNALQSQALVDTCSWRFVPFPMIKKDATLDIIAVHHFQKNNKLLVKRHGKKKTMMSQCGTNTNSAIDLKTKLSETQSHTPVQQSSH